MDSGLQVPDSGFLISEIQSLVGFHIPIISRIPDSNNNFINLLKKGFQLNLQCQISKT